jgi:hypothetical protein
VRRGRRSTKRAAWRACVPHARKRGEARGQCARGRCGGTARVRRAPCGRKATAGSAPPRTARGQIPRRGCFAQPRQRTEPPRARRWQRRPPRGRRRRHRQPQRRRLPPSPVQQTPPQRSQQESMRRPTPQPLPRQLHMRCRRQRATWASGRDAPPPPPGQQRGTRDPCSPLRLRARQHPPRTRRRRDAGARARRAARRGPAAPGAPQRPQLPRPALQRETSAAAHRCAHATCARAPRARTTP